MTEPMELFHDHLRLVRTIASRQPPSAVLDQDDYYSVGLSALWKAANDWDPARSGGQFAGFAAYRVRNAIIEELRRVHGRAGQARLAFSWSQDSLDEWMAEPSPKGADGGRDIAGADDVAGEVEREWVLGELRDAVAELPEREAGIVTDHYARGLTFREIAPRYGVSASRVGQLRDKALGRLRQALAGVAG